MDRDISTLGESVLTHPSSILLNRTNLMSAVTARKSNSHHRGEFEFVFNLICLQTLSTKC